MQIALICPNYPPSFQEGGVSHYTQRLAESLCKMGDKVFIITNEGYLGNCSDGNITVLRFPGKWNRQTVREVAIKLRSLSIEIINLQYTPSMYSVSFKFAWRYLAKRFVSTISFHTLWGGSKLNYLFARSLAKSTDGIIGTNTEIIYLLKKYFGKIFNKVEYIPIGPNIEPEKEFTYDEKVIKKYHINSDGKVISYFGMAYPGKGVRLLLEALENLTKSTELNIQLLIIGGGLSDLDKYILMKKELAKKLGIGNRVIWTGKIEATDVSDLLTLSDLVVLPFSAGASDRRGSLLTALAHKKAVITTKPKIAMPLFENGVNMIWPRTRESDKFAKTIYQLLTNNQFKTKLEHGASELINNYKWSQIGRQTHDFMNNVIANKL